MEPPAINHFQGGKSIPKTTVPPRQHPKYYQGVDKVIDELLVLTFSVRAFRGKLIKVDK